MRSFCSSSSLRARAAAGLKTSSSAPSIAFMPPAEPPMVLRSHRSMTAPPRGVLPLQRTRVSARSRSSQWSLEKGGSEPAVHDVQADVPVLPTVERFRDGPDHLEAERSPQPHGRRVGLDDGVELHGPEARVGGPPEYVFAESPSDALPRGRG